MCRAINMSDPNPPSRQLAPPGASTYEIDRRLKPLLRIHPGDTVVIETEDAFSGQIRRSGDRRDKTAMPYSNPVRGPVWVDGAEPGDALSVHIESIESLRGSCATYVPRLPHITELLGSDVPEAAHVCAIRGDAIAWSPDISLPFRPMIGVIATAPADGVPTTTPAGDYGGNLDLVEVGVGNSVWLPVAVPGGLLFLGDCHALQGQGEVTAAALEMAARVTVVVQLHKDAHIPGPRIETPTELAAVAVARNLERAIGTAFARLALWLERDYELTRWDAYSLLAQVGGLSIGYVLSGAVAAKIERARIPTRGAGQSDF